jgi:hypothetical protein
MDKLRKTIQKFLDRGCVSERAIKTLSNYFVVAKRGYIRPVFDGTKSGLNAALGARGSISLRSTPTSGHWT